MSSNVVDGLEFHSRLVRYQVTTLDKLFTPTCLCRCTWSSGWCRLVTFRLRFDSHRGSFASNVEQVANLLCAQVNSASYPQQDEKWVVAYELWDNKNSTTFEQRHTDSVADWGGGMSASCKPRIQLFADAGNGWSHSVLRYIISSCQSASTSVIVKYFWSRTHVRSGITSIAFTIYLLWDGTQHAVNLAKTIHEKLQVTQNVKIVKGTIQLFTETQIQATDRLQPYRIAQFDSRPVSYQVTTLGNCNCYLPPDTSERAPP